MDESEDSRDGLLEKRQSETSYEITLIHPKHYSHLTRAALSIEHAHVLGCGVHSAQHNSDGLSVKSWGRNTVGYGENKSLVSFSVLSHLGWREMHKCE